MRIVLLLIVTSFCSGCISFGRYADFLVDTEAESFRGTCYEARYQSSIEVKKTGMQVRSSRFVEFGAAAIIVPFEFTKSDSLYFDFSNMSSQQDPEAYLQNMRLQIADYELKPSRVEKLREVYRIEFPLKTTKEITEVTLKLSPDLRITYHKDPGWSFMIILVPHSSGCSGTDKI